VRVKVTVVERAIEARVVPTPPRVRVTVVKRVVVLLMKL
jgi:hypothetical protein